MRPSTSASSVIEKLKAHTQILALDVEFVTTTVTKFHSKVHEQAPVLVSHYGDGDGPVSYLDCQWIHLDYSPQRQPKFAFQQVAVNGITK